MLEYITYDVVKEHVDAGPSIHEGEIFFTWHIDYIGKMENFLLENGGEEFVPLPYYAGVEKIPEEFMVAKLDIIPEDAADVGPRLPPQNGGPFHPFRILPEWRPPLLCQNDSIEGPSFQSIMAWHNNMIHFRIGGILERFWSPCAPIFFLVHAFIIDLYTTWQDCRGSPTFGMQQV